MNRVLLSILRKEFMHIWRDPQTLLIILVWPVLMLLVFSYAITLEMRGIPTGLVDLSGSPDSRHLVQSITASGFFDLVEQELHPEEYEELFQRGAVRCIIVIPADYSRSLATEPVTAVQVLIDAADPNAANFIHNYLNSILLDTSFELNRISVIPFTLSPRFLYNPDLSSTHFFVPGLIAVILLLISALLTSIAIVREKEMGTLEQVLVSPARARQIILGKVIPYILLGFLDGAIVLAVGILWFQVPLHGELWQVLLAMLERERRGGEGKKIDISLAHAAVSQKPPGTQTYRGSLTVVYASGEEGFMEPSFTIEVLPPLGVRVPREEVDLEARSLVAYLDRPAGAVEITVIADTGEVIDQGSVPFAGEAPETPLRVTWRV